jgi:peroxiredoxin family protein
MEDLLIKDAPVTTEVDQKKPIKKMCFILSKAGLDSVYASFIMANGARMEGIEAEIFFTFFGLEAVNKKRLEHLHIATVGNPGMHIPTLLGGLPGMETFASSMMKKQMEDLDLPPVHEFLDILTASGVRMYGCKLAIEMFKLKKEDLYEGVEDIITVGQFYEHAAGDGTHIVFI